MRIVLQRVKEASVSVDGKIKGAIQKGLLLLLGVEHADSKEDLEWMVRKVVNMRIFSDEEGKMNLSVQDISGEILVISQFTLHASTKKGNRPSFIKAAHPEQALRMYEQFIQHIQSESGLKTESGVFGADMQVSLINDGPVTICLDSQNKE